MNKIEKLKNRIDRQYRLIERHQLEIKNNCKNIERYQSEIKALEALKLNEAF